MDGSEVPHVISLVHRDTSGGVGPFHLSLASIGLISAGAACFVLSSVLLTVIFVKQRALQRRMPCERTERNPFRVVGAKFLHKSTPATRDHEAFWEELGTPPMATVSMTPAMRLAQSTRLRDADRETAAAAAAHAEACYRAAMAAQEAQHHPAQASQLPSSDTSGSYATASSGQERASSGPKPRQPSVKFASTVKLPAGSQFMSSTSAVSMSAPPPHSRQNPEPRPSVPSTLLQGLGNLLSAPKSPREQSSEEQDEESYTPVLDLGIDGHFEFSPKDAFERERSAWMEHTLDSVFEGKPPSDATAQAKHDLESAYLRVKHELPTTGKPARVAPDYVPWFKQWKRPSASASNLSVFQSSAQAPKSLQASSTSNNGDENSYHVEHPGSLKPELSFSESFENALNAANIFASSSHGHDEEPEPETSAEDSLLRNGSISYATAATSDQATASDKGAEQVPPLPDVFEQTVKSSTPELVNNPTNGRKRTSFSALPSFRSPYHHTLYPDSQEDDAFKATSSESLMVNLRQKETSERSGLAGSLAAKLSFSRLSETSNTSPRLSPGSWSAKTNDNLRGIDTTPQKSTTGDSSIMDTPNSFGPPIETWNVSTTEVDSGTPFLRAPSAMSQASTLGLGLGLSENRSLSIASPTFSLDGSSTTVRPSPATLLKELPEETDEVPEIATNQELSATKRISSPISPDTLVYTQTSPLLTQGLQLHSPPPRNISTGRFADAPETPALPDIEPVQPVAEARHSRDSTNKHWTLNQNVQDIHRFSVTSSSYCESNISSFTGHSESIAPCHLEDAQGQRSKLLQSIQRNQPAKKADDGKEQHGFTSHSARWSFGSANQTQANLPSVGRKSSRRSSSKPAELALQKNRASGLPTPPLTPFEASFAAHLKNQPEVKSSEKTDASDEESFLDEEVHGEVAAIEEEPTTSPTPEERKADRLLRLRPLSLAQNQHTPSSSRNHRSMNSQSSSGTGKATGTMAASNSGSSLGSVLTAHSPTTARHFRLSTSSHNQRMSRASVASNGPLGVLPSLPADSTPSFLPSPHFPTSRASTPRASFHSGQSKTGAMGKDSTEEPSFLPHSESGTSLASRESRNSLLARFPALTGGAGSCSPSLVR